MSSMEDWPELDHALGRAKAEETAETCWMLRRECHQAKTLNHPSAEFWLLRFVVHATRHGYADAVEAAKKKLDLARFKAGAA
jgi:hypothetical protein